MSYLFGEKLSTTYKQVIAIGGDDDRAGISATAQKAIWTDDGSGGINAFPLTAAQDALQITSTNRLEFNNETAYIYGSSSGVLATSAATSTVIGTALFDLNASSGITIDGTTVSIDGTGTSNFTATGGNLTLSTVSSGEMFLTPVNYIQVASGKKLQFADSGEYISGNTTDLTLGSGSDINLTATTNINVPSGVGLAFGDDGEKISGDGTDLTISASAKLNLTAISDIHIPKNVGLVFDDNASEKIESNNTNLTINSGADINLTCATGDVNIPADIGLTMGSDNQKIEGDGTDLAISATGNINVTSTVNEANAIYIHENASGGGGTIKIHADQGATVTEASPSILLLSDAGGIGLRSTADLANAINLTVDNGTTSSITLFNDTGDSVTEGAASIQLLSDDGGIGIKSTSGLANAILLTADGGVSETIKVHADQGTGAASIELTSDVGGIGINTTTTGKSLDINTAILDIDMTEASNITMATSSGSTTSLTIEASNDNADSDIVIDADGQVHIKADVTTNSYAGAGIQIGTDTTGVDISIGHTTSDVRIGDNLLVTGDGTVTGDLTVSGTINGTHATSATTLTGSAPILTLYNTANEDTALDDSVDTSVGRETKIVFKGDDSADAANILASIVAGHSGTGTDQKGQIQFFINSGAQSDTALSNVMNIIDTGRVGIGVTSPSNTLHLSTADNDVAQFTSTDDTSQILITDDGDTAYFGVSDDGGGSAVGVAYMGFNSGEHANNLNIDANGKVGIGTTSPDCSLEIVDDQSRSSFTGTDKGILNLNGGIADTDVTALTFTSSTEANPCTIIGSQIISGSGSNLFFGTSNNFSAGVTNTSMFIQYDGKVGIGTNAPSAILETSDSVDGEFVGLKIANFRTAVDGDTGDQASIQFNFKNEAATLQPAGKIWSQKIDDYHGGGTAQDSAMDFYTALNGTDTFAMRIDNGGSVGIGTTSPGAALEVVGAASPVLIIRDSSTDADHHKIALYEGADTIRGFIGSYSAYSVTIHSSGGTPYAGLDNSDGSWDVDGGAVGTYSDSRIKKDIDYDFTDGLDIVNQLKPVTYRLNGKAPLGDEDGDDVTRFGLIADDVIKIAPQYVGLRTGTIDGEEVDDLKKLKYTEFIPMLMKAIQELSAKVTALENA